MNNLERICDCSVIPRAVLPILFVLALTMAAAPGAEAGVVRDQWGRSVSVPENPVRVVSLAPSITEIVFALGEGHRLKGVTRHCDFPPEAQSLPRVGSYVHLDLERIVALEPDLCIATRDGNPRDVVDRLEALGIPVYVVNPGNLEAIVDACVEIGHLLNAGPKASALAEDMRARIDRVKSRVSGAKHRPEVFLQIGIVPIVSAGSNTYIDELITTAGGKNLAGGPTPYPRFSREQVLALQPEVLLITTMTQGEQSAQAMDEWKQYTGMPAVKNNRIYIVESNIFDRPTPRLVDALETLARIIHPELF